MSLPFLLIVVALVLLIWIGLRNKSVRATPIAPDDPLWVEAIQRARATVPTMKQLHKDGHEVWVKFPLRVQSQQVEHVWGRLVKADDTSLSCTIETPPIAPGVDSDSLTQTATDDLEDWQVALADGSIRGGFTTRAQARIAEREGHRVPRHVREMLRRMID